jgi:quinol monooxygenase YgiN
MDVGERVPYEDCRIVELRRYALKPGARDTLIELFDREFIETQEEGGMQLLGQFRDLDDPDSFVWLRCFRDMSTRKLSRRG